MHARTQLSALLRRTKTLCLSNPSTPPLLVPALALRYLQVNHKHRAVIRYIGETNFAPGSVWYGLELERPIGKHTGTVLGVRYFDAKEKRGTFVLRENLSPFDAAEEAAARIQANVRGMTAKKKVAKEVAWRAFNTLDANDEAQVLQRRARLMTSALGARLNRERPDDAALEVFEAEAAAMVIEEDYDGPVLEFPLTEDAVMSMMNGFRAGKPLHYKFAVGLMAQYRRFIGALPTLVYSEIAPGTRLTVCGDTHGQLQDLFSIFTINGIPSRSNRYLMNGDFVDRGEWACEILFTLMAFAMLHPGEYGTGRGAALMINRGNHESANQNLTGGFMIEVRRRGLVIYVYARGPEEGGREGRWGATLMLAAAALFHCALRYSMHCFAFSRNRKHGCTRRCNAFALTRAGAGQVLPLGRLREPRARPAHVRHAAGNVRQHAARARGLLRREARIRRARRHDAEARRAAGARRGHPAEARDPLWIPRLRGQAVRGLDVVRPEAAQRTRAVRQGRG